MAEDLETKARKAVLDIKQKIFWIENTIYLCFGIVSLILVILSLTYIQKEQNIKEWNYKLGVKK